MEFGAQAFCVEVAPHERFAGDVRLGVPLQEWNAYFLPVAASEADIVVVEGIVLHVDVVPPAEITWLRAAHAAPGFWELGGEPQRHSLAFDLDAPVPVARRRDAFPRPGYQA